MSVLPKFGYSVLDIQNEYPKVMNRSLFIVIKTYQK